MSEFVSGMLLIFKWISVLGFIVTGAMMAGVTRSKITKKNPKWVEAHPWAFWAFGAFISSLLIFIFLKLF